MEWEPTTVVDEASTKLIIISEKSTDDLSDKSTITEDDEIRSDNSSDQSLSIGMKRKTVDEEEDSESEFDDDDDDESNYEYDTEEEDWSIEEPAEEDILINGSQYTNERLLRCIHYTDGDKYAYRRTNKFLNKARRYYKSVCESDGFDLTDWPGFTCGLTWCWPKQHVIDKRHRYPEGYKFIIHLAHKALTVYNQDNGTNYKVQDPYNSSQTIYASWVSSTNDSLVGRLGGAGSDYSAFVQHIGVPSVDISYGGGYPVYHSMYDDFTWMKKFGDPEFQRHTAVASIWGLVALRLADDKFLPFNYLNYAADLQKSAEDLEREVLDKGLTVIPLLKSIDELKRAAININNEIEGQKGTKTWTFAGKNDKKVRELNDRLMMTERAFTDGEGLAGRSWYKHLIYAPSKHDDYGSKSFPGIGDAIEKAKSLDTANSWQSVQHEIWRVSRAIT